MKIKPSEIFKICYKMSALSRYSQSHLIKPENNLEHTGFVCITAYYITSFLLEMGHEIDIGMVMSRAAVHDIDEIITGDIPRPTKYSSTEMRIMMENTAKHNMEKISTKLSLKKIYNDWKTSKAGLEGAVVGLCDHLAVVNTVFCEVVLMGNKTIIDHVEGIDGKVEYYLNIINYSLDIDHVHLQPILDDVIIKCNRIKREK